MNVLFLTCWYPDIKNPGAGVFIKEHAKAIASQPGIDLKVLQVWPQKGSSLYRLEANVFTDENGIETHQIFIYSFGYKAIYLFNRLLNSIAYAYAKKHILKIWMPDIVHGNVVFQAGVISAFLAKKIGVPYMISEHWSGLEWYLKTAYVQSAAGVKAYKNAKCIFPVSKYLRANIEDKIAGNLRLQVVPNVVDTKVFRFKEREENFKRIQLLCVTNFKTGRAVFKLPGLILDALELMTDAERENYEIRFVGGGDGLAQFEERIEKSGFSDYVHCLGFRQKEEIADLMQTAHALVHPSIAETFGVVIAEALCCGTPCVVSDVPALNELVNQDCGIKVAENTPEAWKNALMEVSNSSFDYDRRAISKRACSKFNSDRVGSLMVDQY